MISLQKQIQWLSRIQIGLFVAFLAGGVLFYFVHYRPTIAKTRQAKTNIQATEIAIKINIDAARDLESLQRQVDKLKEQIDNSRQLKSQPELPRFIREVTQFSHNSGLMRFNCVPNEKIKLRYCAELPIALNFSGPFNDVVGFLKQAETMNRMTRTRSLVIRSRNDVRNGIVDVKLSMSLFFSED